MTAKAVSALFALLSPRISVRSRLWRVDHIQSMKGENPWRKPIRRAKRAFGRKERTGRQATVIKSEKGQSNWSACWRLGPQDQARYGAAPLLPHELEERYSQIHKWLEPGIGGYQSRFEHHLKKEMVDNVWERQRSDHAETALTNRLARQLMETAAPSTPSDLELGLSGLFISQLLNLPAPRELSREVLAKLESPSPLRAVAMVKNQPARAALLRRSKHASKCFNASSDLMMELRSRRAHLQREMDARQWPCSVRVRTAVLLTPRPRRLPPIDVRQQQLRVTFKNRIVYATRDQGWTAEGAGNLRSRFPSPWRIFSCPFANLYKLDIVAPKSPALAPDGSELLNGR